MDTLNIVAWLIIGAIAGLIAAVVTRRKTWQGYLVDLLTGLVGGFVGGFLLYALNITTAGQLAGINVLGAVIALVGSIILIAVVEYLRRSPQ